MLGPDLGGRQKVRPLAQRIASCSTRTTCEPRQRIKAPQQFEGYGEHGFRSTRDRSAAGRARRVYVKAAHGGAPPAMTTAPAAALTGEAAIGASSSPTRSQSWNRNIGTGSQAQAEPADLPHDHAMNESRRRRWDLNAELLGGRLQLASASSADAAGSLRVVRRTSDRRRAPGRRRHGYRSGMGGRIAGRVCTPIPLASPPWRPASRVHLAPHRRGPHSRVRPIRAPARLTLACGRLQHAIPTRPLWPTEMAIGQVGTRLDSGRSSDGLSPGKPQVRAPSLPPFAEPSAVSFIASSDVPTPRHRGFRRRFVRPRLDRRSLAGGRSRAAGRIARRSRKDFVRY